MVEISVSKDKMKNKKGGFIITQGMTQKATKQKKVKYRSEVEERIEEAIREGKRLSVLTELKNRGVKGIYVACVDGLKGGQSFFMCK